MALVPLLSIGENIFLGNERGKKAAIDWDDTYGMANKYMKQVGLSESSRTLIKDIGTGKQQLVEIAKALSKKCSLLILGEPTAALNEKDSKNLLDLLKSLQKEGMTCIIISHKLNEIVYVADSVTVLRDGQTVADFDDAAQINEDEIIRHMVGRELSNRYPTKTHTPSSDEVILEVKNWNVGKSQEFKDRLVYNVGTSQLKKSAPVTEEIKAVKEEVAAPAPAVSGGKAILFSRVTCPNCRVAE